MPSSRDSEFVRPRDVIAGLPSYAAGKPPEAAPGLIPYKLSSNENPLGPVAAVSDVLTDFDVLHRYPNPTAELLRDELAVTLGVPAEDIVTGTGSLGALTQVLNAFAGTGSDGQPDEVLYAWRSFEAYPIVVRTAGAREVPVPVTADGRHDLEAMAQAITPRTRVVILCTPNNPTGPALNHAEVERFLTMVPSDVLVVVDEAYVEFVRNPDVVDGLQLYRRHHNVVVLRTFSKAHGLASLRVGYTISGPQVTQHLRKVAVPFGVSGLGEAAAIASLRHPESVMANVEALIAERERVRDVLIGEGWDVPEAQGNFIWLALGEDSAEFARRAGEQALAVRAFDGEGVRVSIGEEQANDRLIQLCRSYTGAVGAKLTE